MRAYARKDNKRIYKKISLYCRFYLLKLDDRKHEDEKMFECSKDGLGNRKHTYSILGEVIEADF